MTPWVQWAKAEVEAGCLPPRVVGELKDLEVLARPRAPSRAWLLRGRCIPEGLLAESGYEVRYGAHDEAGGWTDFYVWPRVEVGL